VDTLLEREEAIAVSAGGPAYRTYGSGKPLLYLPGLEGTGQMFYKQIDDLSRDHRVITLTLRPHGRYGLDRLVEDVEWVLQHSGAGRATVVGESFGGLLTMATALARPGIIERMILVNTFPWFAQRAKIRMGVALFSLLPYSLMKAYRTRNSRNELFSDDIADDDKRRFRAGTRFIEREGYLSRLRIIRDTDLRPHLGYIDVPAIVVAGTSDKLFDSTAYARSIASCLPRARLKLLHGTGHTALIARGVRVRDWLDDFSDL
jgi:3-oxoadipate enol-lactonase